MNGLKDTHFLDGVAGWTASAGAVATDETTYGGPGRGALVLTGTASAPGDLFRASSLQVDCTAGDPVEIAVLAASTGGEVGAVTAEVRFYASGGSQIAAAPLTRKATANRAPSLGAPGSFDLFGLRTVAPAATAKARLVVTLAAPAAGAVGLALTRPFLDPLAPKLRGLRGFDPGPSDNADLADMAAWPNELSAWLREASQFQPYPSRAAFQAGSNIPLTSDVNDGLAGEWSGALRCTEAEADILMAFFRDRTRRFWFLRPDTGELGIARWAATGDPAIKNVKPSVADYQVGLTWTLA